MMKPNNHQLTKENNDVLVEFENKTFVTLTKLDTQIRHNAINKMQAYGLIEEKSRGTYMLTVKGYKAIKIGGFEKWEKSQNTSFASIIAKGLTKEIIGLIVLLIGAFIVYRFGWN